MLHKEYNEPTVTTGIINFQYPHTYRTHLLLCNPTGVR